MDVFFDIMSMHWSFEDTVTVLIIGLIPAIIAYYKGRNFFLWYFYGVMLWIVAIVHALCISKSELPRNQNYAESNIHKYCPRCHEEIPLNVNACPHCNMLVNFKSRSTLQKIFDYKIAVVLMFCLSFVFVGYAITASNVFKSKPPAQWHAIKTISGTSIKNTESFYIPAKEWKISWDTQPGKYGNMNFQIFVYNAKNKNLVDVAANVIGASKDSTIIRDGYSDYYLTINSAQPYQIKVEAKY